MKNKKGFTLIELLVVIALMLSILGIAIVSFINISNKKKEEAWNQVMGQIETAATEYFTSNEYMFEGLSEGATGYVSVGKLVEYDYLNKITNPATGEVVDYCSLVEVSKSGNKLVATYDGKTTDTANCDNKYITYVTEPGAPSINPEVICTKSGTDWCTSDATININLDTKGNGAATLTQNAGTFCSGIDSQNKMSCTQNGIKSFWITATNTSNKSVRKEVTVMIDKMTPQAPNINVDGVSGDNGWYKQRAVKLNSSSKCSNVSGCVLKKGGNSNANTTVKSFVKDNNINEEIYQISNSTGTTKYSKICSGAGLCSTVSSKTVKVDSEVPSIDVSIASKNSNYNTATALISFDITDSYSGINTVSSNVKNTRNQTSWNKNGASSWKTSYDAVVSSSLDGTSVTPKLDVTDMAGNSSSKDANKYDVYKECDKNIKYEDGTTCTKTCGGGTYNRLAYDSKTGARCSAKDKNSGGSACNTQACPTTSPHATSCSATVTMSNKDCKSSAGNHVSAQLKIKCNGKIDYVEVNYYYPNAKNSVCNANTAAEAVCTHYPGGSNTCNSSQKATNKINGAVFNFTGCGTNSLKYKYKVVANGKVIHAYGSSWADLDYTINLNQNSACSPDRGSDWFN